MCHYAGAHGYHDHAGSYHYNLTRKMRLDCLKLASRTTSKNEHDVQVGARREDVLRTDFRSDSIYRSSNRIAGQPKTRREDPHVIVGLFQKVISVTLYIHRPSVK
jgi:hypothetical protein